jgi:hypothetical protein
MVLVIAIIVILTGILVVTVGKYLNATYAANISLSQHNSQIEEVYSECSAATGII